MGPGDRGFRDVCDAGTYIVGLHMRVGAWFDAVGIDCGIILPTGQIRVVSSGANHGGPGGRPASMTCANNQVLVALRFGESNDGRKLGSLVMTCRSIITGELSSTKFKGDENNGIFNRPNFDQNCGGEVATGLKGRSGRDVNALGLICGPFMPSGSAGSGLQAGGGRSLPCSQRFSSRSHGSAPSIVLQFHNATAEARQLRWFSATGAPTLYANILPGQTYPQQTFGSHIWELTDARGDCTMIYQAGTISELVEVR
jgi:hypothetical protein